MERVAEIMRPYRPEVSLGLQTDWMQKTELTRRGAVTFPEREEKRRHCDQEDGTWV